MGFGIRDFRNLRAGFWRGRGVLEVGGRRNGTAGAYSRDRRRNLVDLIRIKGCFTQFSGSYFFATFDSLNF